jgi:hypothetical protein
MPEGSGGVVTNLLKGTIEDGVITAATWAPNGLYFDEVAGTNEVNFGRPNMANWKDVSVFFQFKWIEGAQAAEYTLISNYAVNTGTFLIRMEKAFDRAEVFAVFEPDDAQGINTATNSVISDKVSTIAVVMGTDGMKVYINGLLSGTPTAGGTLDSTASGNDLEFGQSPLAVADDYNGDIYCAYIWKDHALTSAEVQSLHARPYAIFTPPLNAAVFGAAVGAPPAGVRKPVPEIMHHRNQLMSIITPQWIQDIISSKQECFVPDEYHEEYLATGTDG